MEKIIYDGYENHIRIIVYAQTCVNGDAEVVKCEKGIYIDDIFGADEHETVLTVGKECIDTDCACKFVSDLADKYSTRDSYELIKQMLSDKNISFAESVVR